MIVKYFEWKIVEAQHFHSRMLEPKGYALAIITTTNLIGRPDSTPCVNLDDKDDMYVIARDLNQAAQMLNDVVEKNVVTGDVVDSYLVESMTNKKEEQVAYK